MLQCHPERGLIWSVFSAGARRDQNTAILRVDQNDPQTLSLKAEPAAGLYLSNHAGFDHGELLKQMLVGQRITLAFSKRVDLPLTGAAKAIEAMISACSTHKYARFKSIAELHETEGFIRSKVQAGVQYIHNTAAYGAGIANAPQRRGLTQDACIKQCLAEADCLVASHDSASGLCTLQSQLGPLGPAAKGLTTVITKRPEVVNMPQLPGPSPSEVSGLGWIPGEDWRGYVSRLRRAAVPMGQNCQAEANEVGRFAAGLSLAPIAQQAVAGKAVPISWTSSRLSARIPAWLVVSVERPARFDGAGFVAVNAGGIGPFGVAQDQAMQRAFAPIYAEEGVNGGTVEVVPLEAGRYTVNLTLVTYLRQCQQELPLVRSSFAIDVAPAAPRIVLRNITEGHPYEHRLDVPEFNRRIEISDTRFVIQDLRDGSEVLAREGKDLRLSPTKRFVSINDEEFYDIFDIIDGAKVARVRGSMLAYWNADSFLVSEVSYWGQTSIVKTLSRDVIFDDQRGPSGCCHNRGGIPMRIDLENNFVRLGNVVKSLLTRKSLGNFEEPKLGPDRGSDLGGSVSPHIAATADFVAPLDRSREWSTPLGPIYVHSVSHMPIRDDKQSHAAAIRAMIQPAPALVANPDFGKSARVMSAALPQLTILRGMPQQTDVTVQAGFAAALARAGVLLAPARAGQLMFDNTERREFQHDQSLSYADPTYQQALKQLVADAGAAGKGVEWARYQPPEGGSHLDLWCEAFPSSTPEDDPQADARLSSDKIDLAYRFNLGTRAIWVTRARCDGGATGASAHSNTTLNVFDTAHAAKWHGEHRVASDGGGGADIGGTILDVDFNTKLFSDRLVVTYAPQRGAIMVFDTITRTFVMELAYGRRGDLLQDVFVDAALLHLFQLNSDGSFTVYRLADGAAILEGRYLDDELVVWTADFQFDATEEGAAFVELRFPGQAGQYSFQQFDGALRVDGLLTKVLAGLAPLASDPVGVPPKLEGRLQAASGRISGLAVAQGAQDIAAVRLLQDGVLTHSFDTAAGALVTVDVARNEGVRWATLVAEDVNGLVSLPLNVDLGADPRGLPRTHFLGVGVDYYTDAGLEPLNYAKVDAARMSDTFAELNGRTITLASNTLLTDRRASKDSIPQAVDTLLETAQEGDHIVLFFAGHGLQDKAGNFFFGLSNTQLDRLTDTALNWSDLAQRFAGKGVRITVLLDACHAGAANSQAFATNDAAVAGLRSALSASMTVLAAAKGRQFSGESAQAGGGFFTQAIRDVLLDSRAQFDENGNGLLEVVEFYRGVKTRVVAQRGQQQTPWLSRNQLVGEYGLF